MSSDVGPDEFLAILAQTREFVRRRVVPREQEIMEALDESLAYPSTATQGGSLIGDFQLVQAMLADQHTGVMAGRALVRDVARHWVDGGDRRIAPSVAKLYCTEMAGRVADLAVQVHGGSGCMRGVAGERIYRDVRLLRLYEGTSEIQRLIIGGGLVRSAAQSSRRPKEHHE
jgi:acyl-CoA dehydrogenase